jgi:periplasmic divalent cation tolerance protein
VKASVVFVTAPRGRAAQILAKKIVSSRLAACVNVVPLVVSHYRWQGKMRQDRESLLVIKTRKSLMKALTRFVTQNHSYSVPEVIALDMTGAHAPYLKWLANETNAR